MNQVMWWVLSGISATTTGILVFGWVCLWKRPTLAVLASQGRPRCLITGPENIDGCHWTIRVHEWVHLFTGAPVILPLWSTWSWALFMHLGYGWLAASLLSIGANLATHKSLEAIADIPGLVGSPKEYCKALTTEYTESGTSILAGISIVVAYPIWRLLPWWLARKWERARRYAEDGFKHE